MALAARNAVGASLSIHVRDAEFESPPSNGQAVIRLTLDVRTRSDRAAQTQSLEVRFEKSGREWLIGGVRAIEYVTQ